MAIDPSPTAEATRLTEPCLTSPTAKMPGMLDSNGWGGRVSGHPWGGGPLRKERRGSLYWRWSSGLWQHMPFTLQSCSLSSKGFLTEGGSESEDERRLRYDNEKRQNRRRS